MLLVLPRVHILADPPYFDAQGVWSEADYLYETKFDYRSLLLEEDSGDIGGIRVYFTVLPPTVLAWARSMGASPSVTLIGYRLFVLTCAAVTWGVMYYVLSRRQGVRIALLATAATASLPLISAQSEIPNTEMPMTSALSLALLFFSQGSIGKLMACLIAAFAMKNSALLATFASGIAFLFLHVSARIGRDANARRWSLKGMLACAGLLVLELAVLYFSAAMNERISVPVIYLLTHYLWIYCAPEILFAFVLMCILLARALGRRGLLRWVESEVDEPFHRRVCIHSVLLAGTSICAMFLMPYHPRYATSAIPFIVIAIFYLLPRLTSRAWITEGILVSMTLVNLVNSHGWLYWPLPEVLTRNPTYNERSLEYRRELKAHQEAIVRVSAVNADTPVIATETFSTSISAPALGFVTRALNGYTTVPGRRPPLKPFLKILEDRPPAIAVIRLDDPLRNDDHVSFPMPGPGDEVLFNDGQPKPLIVYIKRFTKDQTHEQWFVSLLTQEPPALAVRWCLDHERSDLARLILEQHLLKRPDDTDARRLLQGLDSSSR
ncbi:MAG: hypothetical protein U1D30_22085 [Planctomycetota bacterium]